MWDDVSLEKSVTRHQMRIDLLVLEIALDGTVMWGCSLSQGVYLTIRGSIVWKKHEASPARICSRITSAFVRSNVWSASVFLPLNHDVSSTPCRNVPKANWRSVVVAPLQNGICTRPV